MYFYCLYYLQTCMYVSALTCMCVYVISLQTQYHITHCIFNLEFSNSYHTRSSFVQLKMSRNGGKKKKSKSWQSPICLMKDKYPGFSTGTPLQYSCLENPMDGGAWKAAVHGVAEGWTWLSDFTFAFHFHALEKEMATHSSVLAWRLPGMGKPGGLPSMGSHRVGHDWSDLAREIAIASTQ